jgi:hypothetical protein
MQIGNAAPRLHGIFIKNLPEIIGQLSKQKGHSTTLAELHVVNNLFIFYTQFNL